MNPLMVKWALRLAFIGAFALVSWYAVSEHDAFVTYKGKVQQAGEDQNRQAAKEKADHDKQTQDIASLYSDDAARLHAQLDSLRNPKARSGGLRAPTLSAQGNEAPGTQSGNAGSDYGRCDQSSDGRESLCLVERDFFDNALMDAQDVDWWNNFADRMNLPVQ